jgi:formylglycine-generating enzyme required for sulfatase activity
MTRSLLFSALAALALISLISGKEKEPPVFSAKEIEKNLAAIPAGSFNHSPPDHDVSFDTILSRTITVAAFHISKFEVTNGQYLLFVNDLLVQGKKAEYNKALPDTMVWREKLAYNEPYVEYYFRHPAYREYPVVGVTHEQAMMYCSWLTEKYRSDPKRKHKNAVFKLPTREHWEYAARGDMKGSPFPWGGPYMQNAKGQMLANFMRIDQASLVRGDKPGEFKYASDQHGMGVAGKLNDNADVTAPVKSYFPNNYGLYNMSGNVEELVREKGISRGGSWADTGYYLRVSIEETYTDTNATSSQRGFRFIMEVK